VKFPLWVDLIMLVLIIVAVVFWVAKEISRGAGRCSCDRDQARGARVAGKTDSDN